MMYFNQWLKRRNILEITITVISSIVVIFTIGYSQYIAKQIAQRENQQVKVWADATQNKAKLLKLSNEIFENLSKEERIKVELYAKASKLILKEDNNEKLSLLLDIIKLNDNIPTLSTDSNFLILDYRNIIDSNVKIGTKLDASNLAKYLKYPAIPYEVNGKKQFIFYKDSRIFEQLQFFLSASGNSFLNEIGSNTVFLPVVILDSNDQVIIYGNIKDEIFKDSILKSDFIQQIKSENPPIPIEIGNEQSLKLYYQNSTFIKQLKWFPAFLYLTIGIVLLIVFIAIRNNRKHEKNLIWVGMSKETAHQLGTPLSSLVGWLEVLKENLSNDSKNNDVLLNMEKDLNRLNLVADRFGKIGSKPKLELEQLLPILKNNVEYYQTRAPKNVKISLNHSEKDFEVFINKPLFEWVLENLIRNALDAMQGEGTIEIETASIERNYIAIDLKDNGKGIPEHLHSKIFDPGFTTKKRGWGLGLSLCKRIVEEYFEGSIFVKSSKLNEGTVFRILLKNKF